MEFSLMTLGTASALPTANRYPSAHILKIRERLFLIDCGEAAQMQMRKSGVNIGRIDNIFVSHLHGDHIFGLYGLLSTFAMMGRMAPLYIYGPAKMDSYLQFFKENFGEGVKYEINHMAVSCREPQLIHENKNVDIYAFPLRHREETYGYLFKEKRPQLNIHKHLIEPYKLSLYEIARLKEGKEVIRENPDFPDGKEVLSPDYFTYLPFKPRSFAYCSDTAPFKALPEWVKGVDLLYHESTFTREYADLAKKTFHSTAADAAGCALKAGAGKLVLGHYSSRFKSLEPILNEAKEIFENSFLAKEGDIYEI